MKKRKFLILGVAGLATLLSSCGDYYKDPFLDFKNEAVAAFKKHYEKYPNKEKAPLFYFDIETLRGALVKLENNNPTPIFLGQFAPTTFSFSNGEGNYFTDLGNLPITVADNNSDGMPDGLTVGNFVNTDIEGNTTFDIKALMNNLPLVLHEKTKEGIMTYSMVGKDGEIQDHSNAEAYDPNFFFISDLAFKIEGLEGFTDELLNFKGKDVCVLRRDLYSSISEITKGVLPPEFGNIVDFSSILYGIYRDSNGLENNDEMPQTITINGTHKTNDKVTREVVVGPFSFINRIIDELIGNVNQNKEGEAVEETTAISNIHKVPNIVIGEGVRTVSLFAFDGVRTNDETPSESKIKNIYLPSTLQDVQFNAFSNLDIENLYINKTYDVDGKEMPFDYVDFGDVNLTMGDENNSIELNITGSFSHTNITNLNFEGYDNLNLPRFPYSSTINLTNPNNINSSLRIYSKDNGIPNLTKAGTLSEAFKKYKTVNPFYQVEWSQVDLEKKKYVLNSDISSLNEGETLYIPYEKYSLRVDDARGIISSSTLNEGKPQDAFATLKLEKDLVVSNGANLVIGSQIGRSDFSSGTSVGAFAALDLNGHKLTIKNGGKVEAHGIIFDSKDKGKIVVEDGASIKTNLTINDYSGFDEVQVRLDNHVAPFDSYSLNSIKVPMEISSKGTLNTFIDYIGNGFYNQNEITLVSNTENALYQLISGKVVVNQSKISSFSVDTKVKVNGVNLITITDETSYTPETTVYSNSDIPFAISNETFKVDVGNLVINSKVKIKKDNSLVINTLTLNNDSFIYVEEGASLLINSEINAALDATKFTLTGNVKFGNINSFNTFENLIKTRDSNFEFLADINEFAKDKDKTAIKTYTSFAVTGVFGEVTNPSAELIKNSKGYYYIFKNNKSLGELKSTNGDTLASYGSNDTHWIAKNGTQNTLTNITKDKLITSYKQITNNYVLNVGANGTSWQAISNIRPNGTYLVDGKTYIQPFGQDDLFEGNFVTNPIVKDKVFKVSNTGEEYFYLEDGVNPEENKWIKIKGYDNYAVLELLTGPTATHDSRFVVFDGSKFNLGFTYDKEKHIASKESKFYAFTNSGYFEEYTGTLSWDKKQIKGNTNFIYLETAKCWGQVGELFDGVCRSEEGSQNYFYYFLLNGKWYQSVKGEYAVKYNSLADYSFGVLDEKISYNGSKYKFVFKKGENFDEKFELFLPQEMVRVRKEDFEDLWPENTTIDHLYAFRHIVKDGGKKFLFFKDKNPDGTANIKLREFEFAPGFTPTQPDPSNNNILTKFNFIIYKVIFADEPNVVKTIYVVTDATDENNAIYAGNIDDTNSDDYLALAIFSENNPINDLTGNMGGGTTN